MSRAFADTNTRWHSARVRGLHSNRRRHQSRNSGGPLFDAQGRLIGVNGRASFEKRGRVNVGVGYAISINQIKRFESHLRSGRIVDHATLGATVSTDADGQVTVNDVLETSSAFRRGLRYGDEVIEFGGREIRSANALKNALGVFPPGWRVPIAFRREGKRFDAYVRLEALHRQEELINLVQEAELMPSESPEEEPRERGDPFQPERRRGEQPPPRGRRPADSQSDALSALPSQVKSMYRPRRGFANYWYNLTAQQRLLSSYNSSSALASSAYAWNVEATLPEGDAALLRTTEREASIRLPYAVASAVFWRRRGGATEPARLGRIVVGDTPLATAAGQRP